MANEVYPRVAGVQRQDFVDLNREHGYQAISVLGMGKFGTVVQARFTDPSGVLPSRQAAIKVLSLARIRSLLPNHRPREMAASLLVDHLHCIKTLEIIQKPGIRYVVMDLATGGSLSEFLSNHRGTLDHRLVRVWSAQIGSAILYLHRVLRVAHREINLGNILLDGHQRALVSGFTSVKVDRVNVRAAHTRCGSGPYQAPEVFFGASHSPITADIWSYGVVIFALLTSRFVCTQLESTNQDIISRRVNRIVVVDARSVLHMSLETNPERRSTMSQLMESNWLSGQ